MKIFLKPPEEKLKNGKKKKVNLTLSGADTALEFRLNEITALSFGRKYILELIESVPGGDHVEVVVHDGQKKKHVLQYFNMKRNVSCCSCEDFISDQSRYCVHLAAVENAIKYPKYYAPENPDYAKWTATFRKKLIQLPETIKKFDKHYTFFDPYSSNYYSFGKNGPTIETVSTQTFKSLQDKKTSQKVQYLPNEIDDAGLLDGITLFNYQKEVFKNMLKAQRAVCSMVPGAGKTLCTIACYAFIDKYKPDNKTTMLIVVPKSLRRQWAHEIKRACHVDSFQVEKPNDLEKSENENIVIVTYQFLTRHIDKIKKRHWDIVVVDEMQFVRNSETKTWKALNKVKSDFFFGLSGTLIENRLDDLYSVMDIINPGALGPKWKFNDQFQELKLKSKVKWIYKGVRNLGALKELLKDSVFSYDKIKLPTIEHNYIFVDPTEEQKNLHDMFYEEAKTIIAKSLNGHISSQERLMVQGLLLKSRQVGNTMELITKKESAPSKKIQKFFEIVDEVCVGKNQKLVIFSEWVQMLTILDRHLKNKYGFDTLFFTGRQSSEQRQEAIKIFQNDPSKKILLCSDAAATGVDGIQLVCSDMVHFELSWNPAKLDQRSARLHRIGQKNPVNIRYIITKGTIEENIYTLIQEKKNIRIQTLAEFNV